LHEWILNNFDEIASDLFSEVADKYAEENEWDEVETHLMVEEMVEKVKEGLLHVVGTYQQD